MSWNGHPYAPSSWELPLGAALGGAAPPLVTGAGQVQAYSKRNGDGCVAWSPVVSGGRDDESTRGLARPRALCDAGRGKSDVKLLAHGTRVYFHAIVRLES